MDVFDNDIQKWKEGAENLQSFGGLDSQCVSRLIQEKRFLHSGKVRELVLDKKNQEQALIIHTDRLTAFDCEIASVPCKGILLNLINSWWMNEINKNKLVPTSFDSVPHPRVQKVRLCEPLKVEVVVRGYLAGSLLRDYQSGKREVYGHTLEPGLKPGAKFKKPMITPTTKAPAFDHDLPITSHELLAQGTVSKQQWEQIEEYSLKLFHFGDLTMTERGLTLVDTKYEFGIDQKTKALTLIDEIHTPDSSRFCTLASKNTSEIDLNDSYDKQIVRKWLLTMGFQGQGNPPEPDRKILAKMLASYNEILRRLRGQGLQISEYQNLKSLNDL